MANFRITYVVGSKAVDKEVEAYSYVVDGDFIHFSDGAGAPVFSVRAKDVQSVETTKK